MTDLSSLCESARSVAVGAVTHISWINGPGLMTPNAPSDLSSLKQVGGRQLVAVGAVTHTDGLGKMTHSQLHRLESSL